VEARNLDLWLRWFDGIARSGEIHLDVLSKSMLDGYYDSLAVGRHGKPRRPVTRKKLVHAIERFWRWAADEDDLIDFVPRPRTLNMPSGPGVPTLAPSWEQMDACIAATTGPTHRLACVLRYTGLRVQQIMGLRWDDLDLDGKTLTIRGELGKTQQEKRGRIIPVSPHLIELASGWGRRKGWLVGTNRTGKDRRIARQREMLQAWKRAGVKEAVWKGHSHRAFRKGVMSGLKRLGADDEAVKYLVGHDLGVRGHYVDPGSLPLRDTVVIIPRIGDAANVADLDAEREAKTANALPT
jgi:integrase